MHRIAMEERNVASNRWIQGESCDCSPSQNHSVVTFLLLDEPPGATPNVGYHYDGKC